MMRSVVDFEIFNLPIWFTFGFSFPTAGEAGVAIGLMVRDSIFEESSVTEGFFFSRKNGAALSFGVGCAGTGPRVELELSVETRGAGVLLARVVPPIASEPGSAQY